jgi:hypothetical protein
MYSVKTCNVLGNKELFGIGCERRHEMHHLQSSTVCLCFSTILRACMCVCMCTYVQVLFGYTCYLFLRLPRFAVYEKMNAFRAIYEKSYTYILTVHESVYYVTSLQPGIT